MKKTMRLTLLTAPLTVLLITLWIASCSNKTGENTQLLTKKLVPAITKAMLGGIVFNDDTLSNPPGQSCASCHNPEAAFSDAGNETSEGAGKGIFGSRNTPSLKYIAFTPSFSGDAVNGWQGGFMWDGRVNTLEKQAIKPFLNPIEMNNSREQLAKKLRSSTYIQQIEKLYGKDALIEDTSLIKSVADALAAFQRTEAFSPFDSKTDYVQAGLLEYSEEEQRGEAYFTGDGLCIDCHQGTFKGREIFSRFIHHNILIPPNPNLPFYSQPEAINSEGSAFIDLGTANNPLLNKEESTYARGLFKTPSLRNIALTAPYMHNGVLKTLSDVIDFYSVMEDFWPPELDENKSPLVTTILDITDQQKSDLIAFLDTLTDGYPASPEMKKFLREKQAAQW